MSGISPVQTTPIFLSESTGLSAATGTSGPTATTTTEGSSPLSSFGSFLGDAIEQANRADFAASEKVQALASGAADDLHGTMISVKEADISIKLVGTVRNKLLDAFQELWRTSV